MSVDAIVEALRRCNPSTPADATDYVARGSEGVGRPWDIVDRLRVLLRSGNRVRMLLHGSIGVGKTTELGRIARELASDATIVSMTATGPRTWATTATGKVREAALPSNAGPFPEYIQGLASHGRPLLVLIDGLDLLAEDAGRPVFAPGTEMAAPELPAFVAAAPHHLVRADRASWDDRFDLVHLPPFPVFDEELRIDAAVVDHLTLGLHRRWESLDIISADLVRRGVVMSGGIPRDALRILRGAFLAAAGVGKVLPAHLMEGEREVRQDLEQALRVGDEQRLAVALVNRSYRGDARLVVSGAVLPYEGAEQRYWLPHPLLWDQLGRSVPAP